MLQWREIPPVLLLVGLTLACSPGRDAGPGAAPLNRRDSAGIVITENAAPAWQRGQPWQIDTMPEIVIGATSLASGRADGSDRAATEPVLLRHVQALVVLPDGRIVVADQRAAEVMVFDSAGSLVARFGGRGQGPGEFPQIVDVHVCGDDSIAVAADRFHLHIFDDQGGFARRIEFRPGGTLVAVSTDCRRMLIQQTVSNSSPPLGSWGRTEQRFVWFDPTSQAVDTVTSARLLEGWTRVLYGEERPFVIPWGTGATTYAMRGDTLVLGYGRVPELRAYDATGALRWVTRWSQQPRPVTRLDRQHYTDVRREWLAAMPPDPETRFLFPELDEYPGLPSEKPLFDSLLVDDGGGVWVRHFPENSFGLFDRRLREQERFRQTWTVFDVTGRWLGDLTLPDRFDLRAVARGRLYGVATDALDVETVQVLPIRGQAASSP